MLPHNSAHAATAACTSITITLIPAIVNGYCQNFRPIAKTRQWLLHIVHFRAASLLAGTLFPLCPQSAPSRRSNLPTPQTLQLPRHSSRTIWNDIVPKPVDAMKLIAEGSRTIWNDIVPKLAGEVLPASTGSRTIWNDIVPKLRRLNGEKEASSRTIWNDIVPKPRRAWRMR